jgi:hypothetical protein
MGGDPLEGAFWLPPDPDLRDWIRAFIAVDKKGDPTALIGKVTELFAKLEAIAAAHPDVKAPHPDVKRHLADLLRRRLTKTIGPDGKLKGMPGGAYTKMIPSYDRSQAEANIEQAVEAVKNGMDPDAAAQRYSIDPDTLDNALKGKRASTRRMKKRR